MFLRINLITNWGKFCTCSTVLNHIFWFDSKVFKLHLAICVNMSNSLKCENVLFIGQYPTLPAPTSFFKTNVYVFKVTP